MPDVITIPFTTTVSNTDLTLASFVATSVGREFTVKVSTIQNAVVRIIPPPGSPDRLTATSRLVRGDITNTWTPWTTRADGSVESPPIDSSIELEVELALVAANGGEVPRATPIFIIKKGGKPDPFPFTTQKTSGEQPPSEDQLSTSPSPATEQPPTPQPLEEVDLPLRRALLIGADPATILGDAAEDIRLVGITNDIARVGTALTRHGFHCHTLIGPAATRDNILAALRQVIEITDANDTVLLYYTGHGGLARNPDHGAVDPPEPRYFQYIVPSDHSPREFRGIFSAELTALVAGLTATTPNVTVVLDCCHATGTAMGGRRYHPRSVPLPWAGDVSSFVAWLRSEGHDLSFAARNVEGNPHVVRLVACGPEEAAQEYEDPSGDSGGLLTRDFVAQLDAALGVTPPPTWDAIAKAIRATVSAEMPSQTPDALGPIGRPLFSLADTSTLDIFATEIINGHTFLRGGSLHGIRTGDRFLVLPLNVSVPDLELALAELEAELVTNNVTRVKRTDFSDRRPASAGARAIRTTRTARRHLVALTDAVPQALATAIAESPRLALASPASISLGVDDIIEVSDDDPIARQPNPMVTDDFAYPEPPSLARKLDAPLATVTVGEDTTTILDAEGTPVRELPTGDSPEHAAAVVGVLEQLARVQELLDLRSGVDALALTAPAVTWSQIPGPELPASGASFKVGDRFAVTIAQQGPRAIFVSVLAVMPDRSIVLLSASAPQGIHIAPGERVVMGQDRAGLVVGFEVLLPGGLPAAAQPLEIVVVATDYAVDLRPLAADMHDVNELIARVGKRVVYLGENPPPTPRECRLAVVRRSARVSA